MSMEQEVDPTGADESEAPHMEDIHPNMTAAEKKRALDEILRVLRGGE